MARTLARPGLVDQRRMLEYDGRVQSLTEWADEFGIDRRTLRSRMMQRGWTLETALKTPVDRSRLGKQGNSSKEI